MNETVREWVEKAQGDYAVACREASAPDGNFDAVIYHSHQCVEKLMKGLLIANRVVPPKVHDLNTLDHLLRPVCPGWDWRQNELRDVTRAGYACRYPGSSYDGDDARLVLGMAGKMRQALPSVVIHK